MQRVSCFVLNVVLHVYLIFNLIKLRGVLDAVSWRMEKSIWAIQKHLMENPEPGEMRKLAEKLEKHELSSEELNLLGVTYLALWEKQKATNTS